MLSRLRVVPRQMIESQARRNLMAEGYDALFLPDGSGAHPPVLSDLWSLAKIIREIRPAHVLEYGTGWSSYVIAETLARTGNDCRLTVVELDRHWLEVARSRISARAKEIVSFLTPKPKTLIYNSAACSETNGWYGWWQPGKRPQRIGVATIAFSELHQLTPDLIYLDGPGKRQVSDYVGLCNEAQVDSISTIVSDPLFMSGPFTICVDGRQAQAAFLKANLPPIYEAAIYRMRRITLFTPRKGGVPSALRRAAAADQPAA